MSSSSVVATAAFDAAMASGDLATIQAHFSQPHVRANLAETEALIRSRIDEGLTDFARTVTLSNGERPWFRTSLENERDDFVTLVNAARRGHVDVIAWLFSRENAHRMGATLALLLPHIALFRDRRFYNSPHPSDSTTLEALLTSYVFCELYTDEQKQSVLDTIAGGLDSPPLLDVAIAHGARLNTASSVIALYGLERLGSGASFLLGGDVLLAPSCLWEHAAADDSFLLRGDDESPDRLAIQLHDLVRRNQFEDFDDIVADGFLDVDARDHHGLTPLIYCATADGRDNSYAFWSPAVDMGDTLLCYGADITFVDSNGRSALHYARNCRDATLLFLGRDADPTVPDHYGVTAFDWIVNKVYYWYEWDEIITLCLERGADPFAQRPAPLWHPEETAAASTRSLVDRLNERDEGKAFMRTHAQLFQRITTK